VTIQEGIGALLGLGKKGPALLDRGSQPSIEQP
jgi:hypothetical protein